jgi:hypothetical protein
MEKIVPRKEDTNEQVKFDSQLVDEWLKAGGEKQKVAVLMDKYNKLAERADLAAKDHSSAPAPYQGYLGKVANAFTRAGERKADKGGDVIAEVFDVKGNVQAMANKNAKDKTDAAVAELGADGVLHQSYSAIEKLVKKVEGLQPRRVTPGELVKIAELLLSVNTAFPPVAVKVGKQSEVGLFKLGVEAVIGGKQKEKPKPFNKINQVQPTRAQEAAAALLARKRSSSLSEPLSDISPLNKGKAPVVLSQRKLPPVPPYKPKPLRKPDDHN